LRSFYDALANDDHPIGPLLCGLNENVRQFFGKNEEAQKEWTEKTGDFKGIQKWVYNSGKF
jgi:hypothetical protein